MKILNMVIPILMCYCSFVSKWSVASGLVPQVLQRTVTLLMTSNCFLQYIPGYTVANFWHYPIRSRITKASALEFTLCKYFRKEEEEQKEKDEEERERKLLEDEAHRQLELEKQRQQEQEYVYITVLDMSRDMRFPTMWFVRPAKAQTSLCIHTVWSKPLLLACIFYDC